MAIKTGEIIRIQITPDKLKQVFDKWVAMIGVEIADVKEEDYALLFLLILFMTVLFLLIRIYLQNFCTIVKSQYLVWVVSCTNLVSKMVIEGFG